MRPRRCRASFRRKRPVIEHHLRAIHCVRDRGARERPGPGSGDGATATPAAARTESRGTRHGQTATHHSRTRSRRQARPPRLAAPRPSRAGAAEDALRQACGDRAAAFRRRRWRPLPHLFRQGRRGRVRQGRGKGPAGVCARSDKDARLGDFGSLAGRARTPSINSIVEALIGAESRRSPAGATDHPAKAGASRRRPRNGIRLLTEAGFGVRCACRICRAMV